MASDKRSKPVSLPSAGWSLVDLRSPSPDEQPSESPPPAAEERPSSAEQQPDAKPSESPSVVSSVSVTVFGAENATVSSLKEDESPLPEVPVNGASETTASDLQTQDTDETPIPANEAKNEPQTESASNDGAPASESMTGTGSEIEEKIRTNETKVEHEARPVDEGDTEYLHDAVAAKEPVSESAYSTSSWSRSHRVPPVSRVTWTPPTEENDDEEDSDKQRATESKEEARPVPRIVKNESPMPKPAAPPLLKPEAEPWRSPPEQDALIDRYLAHDSGLRVERGAHWWVFVLLLLLAVTIGKAALWETLPLTDAEALVASRSDTPALAAFEAPGMAFWLTHVGTRLLGDGPLGARVFALLAWFGTGLFLFLLGRSLLRSDRLGFYATALYAFTPAFHVYDSGSTPVTYLLFFWSGALTFLYFAAKRSEDRWFVPMGLFLGLALTSHYLAVLFYPLMLLYLAWAGKLGSLFKKGAALGLGLSLLGALPTLAWNARLDFVPLLFQFVGRHEGPHFDPVHTLQVLGPLGLWLNPLLVLLFVAGALLALKHTFDRFDAQTALVPVFGILTTLFTLGLVAWSPSGEAQWALAGLWPLFLYAALMLTKLPSRITKLAAWGLAGGIGLVMLALLGTHLLTDKLEAPLSRWVKPEQDPTTQLWGYKELSRTLKSRKTALLGSGFVFSDDPALCAQLRVAKRTDLPVFCLNAVPDPDDVSGLLPPLSRDGLFVTDRDVNPNDLYDCERISTAGRETIRRAGRAIRIFQVHHCRNYRGLRESGSPNPSDDPLVLPNEAKPEDAALPAVPEPFIPPDAVPAQDAVEVPVELPVVPVEPAPETTEPAPMVPAEPAQAVPLEPTPAPPEPVPARAEPPQAVPAEPAPVPTEPVPAQAEPSQGGPTLEPGEEMEL